MRGWVLLAFSLSGCLLAPAKVRDDLPAGGGSSGSSAASGSGHSGVGAGGAAPRGGSASSSSAGAPSGGGAPASGGMMAEGGAMASGAPSSSGTSGSASGGTGGVVGNGGGSTSGGGGSSGDPCDAPGLSWKTGVTTIFESYPDPNSQECVEFGGCAYSGQFAFCPSTMPEAWVSAHNIVAAFPSSGLEGHSLCLKSGNKTLVATVLNTCADADCSGCCSANRGDADAWIELEKYTSERWGVANSEIQFADLGPNAGACQ